MVVEQLARLTETPMEIPKEIPMGTPMGRLLGIPKGSHLETLKGSP